MLVITVLPVLKVLLIIRDPFHVKWFLNGGNSNPIDYSGFWKSDLNSDAVVCTFCACTQLNHMLSLSRFKTRRILLLAFFHLLITNSIVSFLNLDNFLWRTMAKFHRRNISSGNFSWKNFLWKFCTNSVSVNYQFVKGNNSFYMSKREP